MQGYEGSPNCQVLSSGLMGPNSFPVAISLPATSRMRVLVVKVHFKSLGCSSLGHKASMMISLPLLRHDIPISARKRLSRALVQA